MPDKRQPIPITRLTGSLPYDSLNYHSVAWDSLPSLASLLDTVEEELLATRHNNPVVVPSKRVQGPQV